jgi:hypothetical protein
VLTVPLGSEVVAMANFGVMVMVNAFVAVCGGVPESVAVMEKLNVPAVVGVPERRPLGVSVRPPGSVLPLAKAQVTAPVPPLEVRFKLKGVLTEPIGVAGAVMTSCCITVMVNALVTVCCGVPESAAFTVKLKVPAVAGMPLICPFAELRPRLAGRVEPLVKDQTIAPEPPVEAKKSL